MFNLKTGILTSLVFFTSFLSAQEKFLFLTWTQKDATTSMTINFYHEKFFGDTYVDYKKMGSSEILTVKASGKHIPGLDGKVFYQAQISGLSPESVYSFVAFDPDAGAFKTKTFKTPPQDVSKINFIVGGDMGVSDSMKKLLTHAATYSPDFVIIGGDIAYGNGKISSWPRWLEWFNEWEKRMVTAQGHTIPLIAAVGNHETDSKKLGKKRRSPFWYNIFRQDKRSYFTRSFGEDVQFFILDTGHLSPFGFKQTPWLKRNLKKLRSAKHKIAVYHIPMYPSVRSYHSFGSLLGRLYWRSAFEKYGVHTAFENHDHALKRTKILNKGKIANTGQGVLYLGDGCFGKAAREVKADRWYLEKAESIEHFWHVKLDKNRVTYDAYGVDNNRVDTYVRDLR